VTQVDITLSRSTFDRLRARTEAALTRLRGIIESRAARGIPRDTHGDLRLGHVYWFPERQPPADWVVVDCIEFNERFRYADPIADIAFLVMELTVDGHGHLARSFAEAYFAASGDEDGRSLLPFYTAYRAAVRGKVEGMKLADAAIPEASRSAALARARAFWLFARAELEEPGSRPCWVLVAGLPGTGKSSLARALAQHAGFSVLRSDEVRKELAGQGGRSSAPTSFGEGLYTPDWDDRTYADCLRRAEELVFQGKRVLLDATFRSEARRRQFLDAARHWGITGCLLLCQADRDVVRHRLDARQADASDAGWTIYQEVVRSWEEPGPIIRQVTRTIDTGGTHSHALAQALAALQEFGLVDVEGSNS
jgi:predicted kinase